MSNDRCGDKPLWHSVETENILPVSYSHISNFVPYIIDIGQNLTKLLWDVWLATLKTVHQ